MIDVFIIENSRTKSEWMDRKTWLDDQSLVWKKDWDWDFANGMPLGWTYSFKPEHSNIALMFMLRWL